MLFPQLVLAHYRYFALHARYGETGGIPDRFGPERDGKRPEATEAQKAEARKDYEHALHAFEQSAGHITDVYWCVVAPSAVALTEGPRHRVLRFLWKSEPDMRLHRETDWLTNTHPDISILLHHCDTIALKSAAVLRGTAKRIALESVCSEERFLLAAAEDRERQRHEAKSASRPNAARTGSNGGQRPIDSASAGADPLVHARNVLLQLEKYYDRAGNRAARIVYFWGMVTGVVVALALAALFALIVHLSFLRLDVDEENVRNFFICYAAGALGAVVSVLMRMKRESGFTLDYEVGRSQSFRLGSFRPFLGAVFGVLIYFALESGLLQIAVPDGNPATDATEVSPHFLAFIAFLAGFSERLAHVVLGTAERSVAATVETTDASQTGQVAGPQDLASQLELLATLRRDGVIDDEQMQAGIAHAVAAEPTSSKPAPAAAQLDGE